MEQLIELIGVNAESDSARRILGPFNCTLHVEEPIEESEPPEHYLTSASSGIQIRLDQNGQIAVIFLYGQPKNGFGPFNKALVSSLSFSSNRKDVEKALGAPSATGKAGTSLLGMQGGWIRYDYSNHSLHFSFSSQSGKIDLVTIMNPDSIPK